MRSPINDISDQSLKLSTLPMPITQAKSPKIKAAENLETIFSSSKYATLGSKRDIALLNAAIDKSAKKAGQTILPKGISTKADNKLTKTRPGPAPGSRPYAKIIGKIARPANIAIKVSKPATVNEVLNIFSS